VLYISTLIISCLSHWLLFAFRYMGVAHEHQFWSHII